MVVDDVREVLEKMLVMEQETNDEELKMRIAEIKEAINRV